MGKDMNEHMCRNRRASVKNIEKSEREVLKSDMWILQDFETSMQPRYRNHAPQSTKAVFYISLYIPVKVAFFITCGKILYFLYKNQND